MTPPIRTRKEPIRHRLAHAFVESAKNTGDPEMIALARRVCWAVTCPRARPCAPDDMAVFRDWCAG